MNSDPQDKPVNQPQSQSPTEFRPNGGTTPPDALASVLNDAIFNLWNVVERITSLPPKEFR